MGKRGAGFIGLLRCLTLCLLCCACGAGDVLPIAPPSLTPPVAVKSLT